MFLILSGTFIVPDESPVGMGTCAGVVDRLKSQFISAPISSRVKSAAVSTRFWSCGFAALNKS
jgi:hypothetical protein